MKNSIFIITTVTLMAALLFSGCDRPSDKVESAETSAIESNRDMEIAKAEVEAEYRIYKLENENRLAKYNRDIEKIKQDISNESDREVRAKLETRLDEKESKYRELKREMDNYNVSGRENWEDFKESFSNRMDDLGDSLDNFFSTSRTTSSRN